MRLFFNDYGKDFELFDDKVNILVIENKSVFRKILCGFIQDTIGEEMTFSENFEPFEFSKKGLFIRDPLNLNYENKKLTQAINNQLEKNANDFLTEAVQNTTSALLKFGLDLTELFDFDFLFNEEITAASLIKFLKFHVNTDNLSITERLLNFADMFSSYCGTKFFVFTQLSEYFTQDELYKLFETLTAKHYFILTIESNCVALDEKYSSVHILDNDLCCIDSDN